jgi:pilus assembly protein Flp/PilA
MTRVRSWMRLDDGASAVEYSLLIAAVAAVIVTLVFGIGRLTHDNFSATCTSWNTAAGNGAC